MTPFTAAALAVLAQHDRRLVAAVLRVIQGRDTCEDSDALPPRNLEEPLVHWACRARASADAPDGWRETLREVEEDAQEQLNTAARLGIDAVPLLDPLYPARLAAIADPPPLLWVRGQVAALNAPCIAIVGSRAATPYGIAMASRLGADLAAAGLVVVSGLARGIDSAAHASALAVSGRTVGVVGCGLDRMYPSEHKDLARRMEGTGAVIGEFPAGVPPLPHHFPLRNRIISGLSIAVVVVEAPEKSGALITASAAADHGREVFVIPGPATGGRNRGGHLLIRDGAQVVESADDIFQQLAALPLQTASCQQLSGLPFHAASRSGGTPDRSLPDLADFTVDEVSAHTGEPPRLIIARLLEMELAGRIQRVGGGRFARVLT